MYNVQFTISKLLIFNCQLLIALVGLSGLEPPTSRLSGVRSNRLSYKPISFRLRGFPLQPILSCLPRCTPLLLK